MRAINYPPDSRNPSGSRGNIHLPGIVRNPTFNGKAILGISFWLFLRRCCIYPFRGTPFRIVFLRDKSYLFMMEAYSPKDNITWILCTRQQIDKKRGCGQIARTPKSESVFFSMLSDLSVRLHRLSILNEAVKHGGDLSAGRRHASQADCRIFPSQDRCRPPIAWPMVMIRFISCSFPAKAF